MSETPIFPGNDKNTNISFNTNDSLHLFGRPVLFKRVERLKVFEQQRLQHQEREQDYTVLS